MNFPEMLKLNNKPISKQQFHEIQSTCFVSRLVYEKENYVMDNCKKLSFDGYKPCKVVFDDNSYIHVFTE